MENKIYGNGIVPLKNEISDRDTPVINTGEILFRDNLKSIKTRLVLLTIVSISIFLGIIYKSYSKITETVFGLDKLKLSVSSLNQGYKMACGLFFLFTIIGLISLYKYFFDLKRRR